MIRLIRQGEGERIGLPGRDVLELVSGKTGSSITFRIVEIPVPDQAQIVRGQHLHHGHEECIYVLRGRGRMQCVNGPLEVGVGDVLSVPPEEPHVTRNVGDEALVLLCFFPTPDITRTSEDVGEDVAAPKAASPGARP